MKTNSHSLLAAALSVVCIASSVGCYSAYPPPPNYAAAFNQDSKGYDVPVEPDPVAPPRPAYRGVDPGLVAAGVIAAGALGYALGNNRSYPVNVFYAPTFYRPVPYARPYYGPRYCY